MEIYQSIVILLLVLCSSLSTDAQPADVMPRYQKFLNQHVYGTMNEHICDSVIRRRDITRPNTNNGCKEVNTFIQANKGDVNAVCTGGGENYGNSRDLYVSTKKFAVITCTLKSGERHPNCEYKKGRKSTRKIVVACAKGWPTHYEEGIIIPN